MEVQYTTYFEDGTSGITKLEKPPGAHPDSLLALIEGLLVAEKTGKKVLRIGRSKVNALSVAPNPLVIDDDLRTREQILEDLKVAMRPISEKYEILFR